MDGKEQMPEQDNLPETEHTTEEVTVDENPQSPTPRPKRRVTFADSTEVPAEMIPADVSGNEAQSSGNESVTQVIDARANVLATIPDHQR